MKQKYVKNFNLQIDNKIIFLYTAVNIRKLINNKIIVYKNVFYFRNNSFANVFILSSNGHNY
jgi:hypothetical protein